MSQTYVFEKTTSDAKDIYTEYLINIVTPLLYEGFATIYKNAQEYELKFIEAEKSNPDLTNPGVIVLFQQFLRDIEKWNSGIITNETQRIKDYSRCSDIFDDLVKAVIKSHIIVMTYATVGDVNKINQIIAEYLSKVDTNFFIHNCYIEGAKIFYNHPYLFYHKYDEATLKDNQNKIFMLVKVGVRNAIYRVLPMKLILGEYVNNRIVENSEVKMYDKVKSMILDEMRQEQEAMMMARREQEKMMYQRHQPEDMYQRHQPEDMFHRHHYERPYENATMDLKKLAGLKLFESDTNEAGSENGHSGLSALVYGRQPLETVHLESEDNLKFGKPEAEDVPQNDHEQKEQGGEAENRFDSQPEQRPMENHPPQTVGLSDENVPQTPARQTPQVSDINALIKQVGSKSEKVD